MLVHGICCGACQSIIFSRTRHDMRWCRCLRVAIDGGFDYTKITGDMIIIRSVFVEIKESKDQLFSDWNNKKNDHGLFASIFDLENKGCKVMCSSCKKNVAEHTFPKFLCETCMCKHSLQLQEPVKNVSFKERMLKTFEFYSGLAMKEENEIFSERFKAMAEAALSLYRGEQDES